MSTGSETVLFQREKGFFFHNCALFQDSLLTDAVYLMVTRLLVMFLVCLITGLILVSKASNQ